MYAAGVRFSILVFVCTLLPLYFLPHVAAADFGCNISPNITSLNVAPTHPGVCPVYPYRKSHDPSISDVELIMVNSTGQTVVINCMQCDKQLRNVRWRRAALTSGEFAKESSSCHGDTLTIPDFKCKDQGNYVCTAECGDRVVDEQWKSIWINQSDPACKPKISPEMKIENKVSAFVGNSLTLPCAVDEGDVEDIGGITEIYWFRGRTYGITPSGRSLCALGLCANYSTCLPRSQKPIREQNVTIRKLRREDTGWYTCQVFFSGIPASVYYYVTVIEKPEKVASSQPIDWTALIASLTTTFGILILIVAIGIWCWWRKKASIQERELTDVTSSPPHSPKSIYISYGEDTPKHLSSVKSMASYLNKSFNCILYDEHRNEAAYVLVHNWLSQQIKQSSCVVIVCSPRYKGLTDHDVTDANTQTRNEIVDWHQRVAWEWNLVQSRAYASEQRLSFCVVVLWDDADESDIPFPLKTKRCFRWPSEMVEMCLYLKDQGFDDDTYEVVGNGGGQGMGDDEEIFSV